MRLAFALCLATTVCLAASPENALRERLYAKLAASFCGGQAAGQPREILLLAQPGFTLTSADCADAYAVSQLADQAPAPDRAYLPSGALLSSVYNTILQRSETSNFQDMGHRSKALQARRQLYDKRRPGRATPQYEAYLTFQAAYLAAQDALALAQTEQVATARPVPPGLEAAVGARLAEWERLGSRKLIEDAQADLTRFQDENLKVRFTNLIGDFSGAQVSDGHPMPWYPVTATPPPQAWLDAGGWLPFSLHHTEKSLPQKASAPLKASRADGGDLEARVSLHMEAKRVTIARPWMDVSIFGSHGWRLQPSSGFSLVSAGDPSAGDPGLMPLITTGLLLARHLTLKGHWKRDKALGPFSLPDEAPTVEQDGDMQQSADGLQIIGFFCTVVPRSPDPDTRAFRKP